MTEIVLTLKGDGPSEPWLVIHADSVADLNSVVAELDSQTMALYKGSATAFRYAGSAQAQDQGRDAMDEAVDLVSGALAAREVEPQPDDRDRAPERRFTAIDGELPKGVKFWTDANPDPEKAAKGYEELFFTYPYIANESNRNRVKGALKSRLGNRPLRWSPDDKAWYTSKDSEGVVREVLAAHADLFA